jgi:deoxyhypusine monooxygenase
MTAEDNTTTDSGSGPGGYPSLNMLQKALDDPTNPVGMRMRAAYYLRQSYENDSISTSGVTEEDVKDESISVNVKHQVVQVLGDSLRNADHGSLLRHEFAYVLGQLRDSLGCPYLEQVLADDSDCIMVRHECSEALGAIGNVSSLKVLQQFAKHSLPEISQTCQIAVDFIQWKQGQRQENGGEEKKDVGVDEEGLPPVMACACMLSPYNSVDPAPPLDGTSAAKSAAVLGEVLRDTSLELFPRYRAMFTLRNMKTKESAVELGNTLVSDESSALMRHEIAYVLGQMQHPASVTMLIESLQRPAEHAMVRHESAEALGAMCDVGGEAWEMSERALSKFQQDSDPVVAESCQVALDAADYWGMWSNKSSNLQQQEGEHEPEEEEESRVLSFSSQKNSLNSSTSAPSCAVASKKAVLSSHFNVAR